METPSLGKLATKAKDPNLILRHGYPRRTPTRYFNIINIWHLMDSLVANICIKYDYETEW